MKALFSFFLIAFFINQSVLAQGVTNPEYTPAKVFQTQRIAGIKLGANVASITNLLESEIFLGYHGGFFGYVQTSEIFGLGGELNFSHQGVTASNIDFSLNYFNIPVMANFYFGSVTFQGGGYGALLMNAKGKAAQNTADVSNFFQGNDYGILFGLMYNTPGRTFFCGRINWGLMNINHGFTNPKDVKLYNRNFQVAFGYRFGG